MSSIIQTNQVFNNEIPFCRVYSIDSKKMLEERFLAHSISYFIEWQDKSFLQRLFDRKGNKIVCTFKINKNELVRAKELSEGIEGIKFKDYGDLKDAARIPRRSEAVKSQPDPMILPALKIEEISDDE